MNALKIKKGDTVVVIAGKDRGKRGKVVRTEAKSGKLVVEGVNMATMHKKPRKQGEEGGIVKTEAPLYACKVMAVCPKCHEPTRVAMKIDDDGAKTRVCRHCGAAI
ncbi:MAG: 50S ribosomal protein L24 [Clostridiales bacterium]|nr:50S ribosomal protein L24 [Clostridiales bacterium]